MVHTGRGHKKVLAKLPKPLDTRREAAKTAGVGERTYDADQDTPLDVAPLGADDTGAMSTPQTTHAPAPGFSLPLLAAWT